MSVPTTTDCIPSQNSNMATITNGVWVGGWVGNRGTCFVLPHCAAAATDAFCVALSFAVRFSVMSHGVNGKTDGGSQFDF